jgi:formylmethanofuran dehydrogenase subunit E-like metal-binding protein
MLYYNCSKGRALRQDGVAPRKQGFEAHQVTGKQRSDTVKKNLQNPIDKATEMWYNKYSQEGSKHNLSSVASAKKIKRNFENPLDKLQSLCYNKYVSEREFSTEHKPCRY